MLLELQIEGTEMSQSAPLESNRRRVRIVLRLVCRLQTLTIEPSIFRNDNSVCITTDDQKDAFHEPCHETPLMPFDQCGC